MKENANTRRIFIQIDPLLEFKSIKISRHSLFCGYFDLEDIFANFRILEDIFTTKQAGAELAKPCS